MSSIKKLFEQTAIYGLSSIAARFLNWLLVPVHTRIFLPETYGIVTEMYAYVTFLMIVMTYGMETGFFRFAKSEKNLNSLYSTSLFSIFTTSFLFVFLFWIFSQNVADFLNYHSHPEYITWMAIIIGLDAFTAIPFAKLRQQNKAIRFVILKVIGIAVNILATLFFLLLCPYIYSKNPDSIILTVYSPNIGVGYVFIANLLASLATLLFMFPDIIKNTQLKLVNVHLLKQVLFYSIPLMVAGLTGMINETIDRILIKNLLSPPDYALNQLGIYGAVTKLAVLMTMFTQTFRYAAEPFFFDESKKANPQQTYSDAMKYFILAGLFIFLGVTLFIDVFKILIGSNFHEGLRIVPLLLTAYLILGIIYNLSFWYKLTDKTRYGVYISLTGAIFTIVFNFILIPVFGYSGAAISCLIAHIVMMVMSYIYGQKYYPINYPIKKISWYFLFAIILFLIGFFVKTPYTFFNYTISAILLSTFAIVVIRKENLHNSIKQILPNKFK